MEIRPFILDLPMCYVVQNLRWPFHSKTYPRTLYGSPRPFTATVPIVFWSLEVRAMTFSIHDHNFENRVRAKQTYTRLLFVASRYYFTVLSWFLWRVDGVWMWYICQGFVVQSLMSLLTFYICTCYMPFTRYMLHKFPVVGFSFV